jgi:hypothetical protein
LDNAGYESDRVPQKTPDSRISDSKISDSNDNTTVSACAQIDNTGDSRQVESSDFGMAEARVLYTDESGTTAPTRFPDSGIQVRAAVTDDSANTIDRVPIFDISGSRLLDS